MKSLFNSPKTSFVGIVPGLILLLVSLSGIWSGPIPVLDDAGNVTKDAQGVVITEPAPPFNMATFIAGLSLIGVGAAAGDHKD